MNRNPPHSALTQFTLIAVNQYLEETIPALVEKALTQKLPQLLQPAVLLLFKAHSETLLMPLLTEYFAGRSSDFVAELAAQLEPVMRQLLQQHASEILKELTSRQRGVPREPSK